VIDESVPPPLFEGSGTDLWRAARELGDEPHLEWTFPVLLNRVLAASPHGLDFAYEYLQGWGQAVGFLRQTDTLSATQLGPFLLTHRSMGLGLRVPDSFFSTENGILDHPRAGDGFRGRHHVAAVGLTPADRIVILNSWGQDWGRGGYGFLGRRFFETYVEEITVTYPTWVGWSPESDRELAKGAGFFRSIEPDRLGAAANVPNRIKAKSVHHRGKRVAVRMRRVLASSSWQVYDIIEFRSETQALLGRGHLLHDVTARQGMVMELWVPPDQRRRGYGSLLLAEIVSLARANSGLDGVTVPLFEADCSREGQLRARGFATSNHMSWYGKGQPQPPVGTSREQNSYGRQLGADESARPESLAQSVMPLRFDARSPAEDSGRGHEFSGSGGRGRGIPFGR